MRMSGLPTLILTMLALALSALCATPASAQGAVTGTTLDVCIARVQPTDRAAALFAQPARFDCTTPQTRFGSGDYWVLSPPLAGIPDRDQRLRVRIASMFQDAVTLYALYPNGRVRAWRYDGQAASRNIQLGAMVEWPLPAAAGPPERLLWRVERSANLRGIVLAPTIATADESGKADTQMAAIYAAFGGLCFALLAYNLAMWGALKHRFQLAYCAMVASLMLYAFTSSGALAWAYPAIANNDRIRCNYVFLATACATAVLFARSFFPPSVTEGWIRRWSNRLIVFAAFATAAFVLFAPWQIRLLDTLYTLGFGGLMLMTVPIIVRARRDGGPYLWLFALGWAAPVIFAGLRLLGNLTLVPWNFWIDNSTILSMAFEAIVSTLAIAYRIRLLSNERDEAIEREIIATRLADTDPLTGLLNRRAFLRHAIGRGGEQALILTDLDHFKQVNETIGHDGGDDVLRVFARTLRQLAPAEALIARMGGEEFAILLPANYALNPDAVLAKLRSARMPFDMTVTTSIGACTGPLATEPDWKAMYRRADRALFDAKQSGRDRARFAPPLAAKAA